MKKPRVTPYQLDVWSSNMAELYNSLEGEIIRILIKRLNRGHDDILQWQAEKLSELRLFNNDITKLLSEVTEVAETEIRRMLEDTGVAAIKDIDAAIPYDIKPMPNNLDQVMRGYYNQAMTEIDNYVNQTLVTRNYGTAARAYQEVLNNTAAMFNTGMYTQPQALERAITELAQKGIGSALVDVRGHRWSIEGYVRNLLKTTLSNTYNEVRTERMAEYNIHTVLVTSHAGARPACSKIQGNVIDLRPMGEIPADSEYKSIYDPYWEADYGSPGGHMGNNCRHLHIPFIPGVNTNNQPEFDDKLNEEVRRARTTQRRIEREIVKYKKSLMVAEEMGSENVDYWNMMVRRRQKAMREHLAENGEYTSRDYKREKVYTPLNTLLKDFRYDT